MNRLPCKPPRICLIGVSGYATVYIDWLLEAHAEGRIDIAAVVALKPEQSSENARKMTAVGAALYDDYQSLFQAERNRIDLCYIPTGIQWHARMTIAALEAGCNVLVEKPLAGSLEDAEKVRKAETTYGRWVAVGFQDMYTEEIRRLKDDLLGGLVGPLRSVAMLGIWPRPESYYLRNHWAGRLRADSAQVLDSPLNNAFAHFVNLALFLAGTSPRQSQTARVTSAQLFRAHRIESFDTAVVHAEGADGVRFWFGVSHASAATREPSIRFNGPEGVVEWFHERHCEIRIDGQTIRYENVPNYDATRRRMFDTVLARLNDPSVAICDTSIALQHTAFIESVHASGEVRSVDPRCIERLPHEASGSTIPAIRGLDSRLESAFQTLEALDNVVLQAASR